MKKILITGMNSYVGNSLTDWLSKHPQNYNITRISMRSDEWKEQNFNSYDCIVHVAGLAHVSTDKDLEDKYYKVNFKLTEKVAEKAKASGVEQFIFLSSIIVYGNTQRIINENTEEIPLDFYGNSKLKAEKSLKELASDDFKVSIIRSPMVFGENSRGNYQKLSKYIKFMPFFPKFENKRSMIYIYNLCEFIRLLIDDRAQGTFYPQNDQHVTTTNLVKLMAKSQNRRLICVRIFNPLIRELIPKINIVNKLFGNLAYDLEISRYPSKYNLYSLEEAIERTEQK
ncbi:NAD-dependent epimerase/dehydratase family protein [Salinicoccus hispanicus]|uniref:NAD-dependent epimerase/dehydratase family protein n=1 Tax=Salinicoccus hispanicus TaxID=157225 RepID=A0A6N8U3G5_9STAP|nr:NAD-dependent epimerase/dehydratase family protein [Salinicoccus hispanicus]MXQ50965.1 NAD-dependent epimerase/dehydratase family protein [Salinicoccus hispanicus]